ncbi:MAG: hypothetical protein J3K34DRAFT_432941 [Monoraphidium minutum]|nr:MAG: hypothetical protein J3K34DRAFT_432941 [Monoraphidium minutum]
MQLTRCAALDLARYRVRVNALCPGTIRTEATRRYAESQGKTLDELEADSAGGLVLQRLGAPAECAAAAAFLLSDDASYVTGAALMVDGGVTAL